MIPLNQIKGNKARSQLFNTMLVLALLCFSAHLRASASCANEVVRMELNEGARVDSKKATTLIDGFSGSDYASSNTSWSAHDYIWRNLQYQSAVDLRFGIYAKSPFKTHVTYGFIRYSSAKPDEPDPDAPPRITLPYSQH